MQLTLLREAYRKAVAEIIVRAPPGVKPGFRPPNAKELAILHSLELPASIELFYEEFAPDEKLGVWGIARDCVLLPIPGIEWYISERQGACLDSHDYVILATTLSGDPYCFDLAGIGENADFPIFLRSHEKDYSHSSREEIARSRKFVSESLLAFLKEF